MEDLLEAQVNDSEDSTDDEIEEDADIFDSDAEQDLVVFSSDEGSELEFESDYESADTEDVESSKSEDSFREEVGKSVSIKLKTDKKKLTNNSVKKSTVSKSKTLAGKVIQSKNKLMNDQTLKSSQETQVERHNLCNKQEIKNVSDKAQQGKNEYEFDSSDEEDTRNTVGNIPIKWYSGYDHLGYDWDGRKILKPEKGDELDNFLKRMEDPDFWRTIKDPQTGQDVLLSQEDIELIVRIQKQKVPDVQFNEYAVSYILQVYK